MSTRPDASPFVQFVQRLQRAHSRRERLQAGLDAVRWASFAYAASLLTLALVAGPLVHRARGVLAAISATATPVLFWVLLRRRHREPGELLSALETAVGARQLFLTAWEWAHQRLSSPLGPAVLNRADNLIASAHPQLSSLVRPLAGQRRTLAAVLAAVLVSLPGPIAALQHLTRQLRLAPAPPSTSQKHEVALSPEEAKLLERLTRLLQRQAAATGDPAARRAASELRRLLSTSRSPSSRTAGPLNGPGGATPLPGAGEAPPALDGGERLMGAPGLSGLWDRVALLMRLAELGLISPETADRSAELAAMLSLEMPEGGSSTSGSEARPDTLAEDTAREGPTQPNVPPEQGTQDDLRRSASGQQVLPGTSAPAETPSQGRSGASAAPSGDASSPSLPQSQAKDEGLPGTGTGALESGGPPADLAAPDRVVLPSSPQLQAGPAHVGSGVPAPPQPERSVPAWEPGPVGSWQIGDAGPPPDMEAVPLEYREAVRRYFEALAQEGG